MLEPRQQCREEKLDEFLSFFSDRNRLRYYVRMMLDRYPPMCVEALGHVPSAASPGALRTGTEEA
jgi:hypothetical protein